MIRSLLIGSLGFAAVSVAAFSLWAFGGRFFAGHGGEAAMYTAIAAVFLGLTGAVLHRLVKGQRALARFYGAFLPAFFVYAVLWCAAWFLVKHQSGEWLGSLAGSTAFAWIVSLRLKSRSPVLVTCLLVFITHSAGYFLGGKLMYGMLASGVPGWDHHMLGVMSKLGWGLLYGLGFGAGIGIAFCRSQSASGSGL